MLINTPLHISRMQQVVGLLASGLAKISGIEFLDSRILMGLADGVSCIAVVENLSSESPNIGSIAYIAWLLRLSAAVDAAAGTSHNFNKVVVSFAGLYFIKQLSGIAQAGGYRYFYFHTSYVVCGLLDTLGTPDFGEVQLGQLFSGEGLHCGS